MYLEHFRFKEWPFALTPNTQFYCELGGHQEALNVLLFSLRSGEGFIKITGEVGCGKTLVCRLLLENLEDEFFTTYIPNPDMSPLALRMAIAKELGIQTTDYLNEHQLIDSFYDRLLTLHQQGKKVVLLIDEAQSLSDESLETVRLLTNLETETHKLLQVVLFGQPELDTRLNKHELRQVKQRISFSYRIPPLNQHELIHYLHHRLSMAGYTYGTLFTRRALRLLAKYSAGIPRVINLICHKALLVTYGRGENAVGVHAMRCAIQETLQTPASFLVKCWKWSMGLGLVIGVAFVTVWLAGALS